MYPIVADKAVGSYSFLLRLKCTWAMVVETAMMGGRVVLYRFKFSNDSMNILPLLRNIIPKCYALNEPNPLPYASSIVANHCQRPFKPAHPGNYKRMGRSAVCCITAYPSAIDRYTHVRARQGSSLLRPIAVSQEHLIAFYCGFF